MMKHRLDDFFKQAVYTVLLAVGLGFGAAVQADFDSGSDGTDGPLVLDTPGEFLFDKNAFSPSLDADGDGIFHFTTINIAAGVIVKFSPSMGPVIWLASGDVTIDGTINLNGERGHNSDEPAVNSLPGPGGFSGGTGSSPSTVGQPGFGPGGGGIYLRAGNFSPLYNGSGAGFLTNGQPGRTSRSVTSGQSYGNNYSLPLIGGSGGAGAGVVSISSDTFSGGGGGGGAVLIAGSSIQINGQITSNGGNGGDTIGTSNRCGGGGSGGAIRLVSQQIAGNGVMSVAGGITVDDLIVCQNGGAGSPGRIRLESFVYNFTGTFGSSGVTRSLPGVLFLPADATPIRILSVGGVAMPANASGGFNPADIVINEAGAASVEIEARGIPVGTVVKLTLFPENDNTVTVDASPLVGTDELSTATANVVIPHGFSRFYIIANWTP